MVISKGLEKGLKTSFSGYLTVKGEKAEDLFLIFSAKELKDFLSKFRSNIKKYPFIKELYKFFDGEQQGMSVLVIWTKEDKKVLNGSGYTFTPCKLVVEKDKDSEKEAFSFVVCGWHEFCYLESKENKTGKK